jgi:hypothetical protein
MSYRVLQQDIKNECNNDIKYAGILYKIMFDKKVCMSCIQQIIFQICFDQC